jgi:hypothetical protein
VRVTALVPLARQHKILTLNVPKATPRMNEERFLFLKKRNINMKPLESEPRGLRGGIV